MSYWHQDETGRWYFDWSHLAPVAPLIVYAVYVAIRRAVGT